MMMRRVLVDGVMGGGGERRPKTKIVCTLGPASRLVEMVEKLLKAGMNVACFNFSHGTNAYHQEECQFSWGSDLVEVRKLLGKHAKTILLMSNVENQVGISNFDTKGQYTRKASGDCYSDVGVHDQISKAYLS
ncbi:hypothetical protein QYF36_020502 [Acer negundo]|nr:hypothetical protein QYF36_020502 [Acer negundo]